MTIIALLGWLFGLSIAAAGCTVVVILWKQSRRPRALCLMYHRIGSREACAAIQGTERRYTLPGEELENQITYLEKHGYRFLTAGETADFARGELKLEQPAVALTFDDGCVSVFESALPILRRHGVPATAFVTTDPESFIFGDSEPRMSDEQLSAIDAGGIRCESHTVTHRPLVQLSDEEVRKELRNSRREIEGVVEHDVKFLSMPGNWIDGRVLRLAQETGYEAVWISEPGAVRVGSNLFAMPRVNVDGTMGIADFAAMLTPWGMTQRHLIYLAKRFVKRVTGPQLWYRIRDTIFHVAPDGDVSLSLWPLALGVPALVATVAWFWFWE